MNVSSPPPVQAPIGILQVLQTALQSQTQMAETLVKVGVEQQIAVDKMAVAGQIIDAYA